MTIPERREQLRKKITMIIGLHRLDNDIMSEQIADKILQEIEK